MDVQNVHPLYHIQRHHLWNHALDEACLEDYNDFPHIPKMQQQFPYLLNRAGMKCPPPPDKVV